MARPREFDTREAVERAMDVFWNNGYEGASLPDLLAGMDIARGSLYKAFKDKRSLFLLAFEHYENEVLTPAVEFLTAPEPGDGWARVQGIFDQVVAAARNGDHRGCLVCTAAAGPAADDPEIADRVEAALEQMRQAFEIALKTSAMHKDLDAAERAGLASALTAQYVGLRIMVRSQAPMEKLERTAASIRHLPGMPRA